MFAFATLKNDTHYVNSLGALVMSAFTHDADFARDLVLGAASFHGRIAIAAYRETGSLRCSQIRESDMLAPSGSRQPGLREISCIAAHWWSA